MNQQLRFCTTAQGVRIAYATVGSGPALVFVEWASHLGLEWEVPRIRDLWETIARHHLVVRYDRHGCGLSDRNRTEISLDSEVQTIEAIVNELGLKSFVLWGNTGQGGAAALTYTVKFPDRVSHLILTNAQARWHGVPAWGGANLDTLRGLAQSDARMFLLALAERVLGPAFDLSTLQWYLRLLQEAATPEMFGRLVTFWTSIDVRDLLSKISVPTLVVHYRNDRLVPLEAGRELAAGIPSARFVPLEGDAHFFLYAEMRPLRRAIAEFLGDPVEEVAQPPAESPKIPSAPEGAPGVFRKDGEFWTIACCGESFHLKDTKGLTYIAQLLRHPRQEIHVLSLSAESDGEQVPEDQEPNEESLMQSGLTVGQLSDAGEMLDPKAKAAYRRRLTELESQLREAQDSGDAVGADKIAEEKEALAAELARAVGLGGRDRRASSASERARINVTRAIKIALDRMANQSAATAALLVASIRTGSFCCYTPDPRLPTAWNL